MPTTCDACNATELDTEQWHHRDGHTLCDDCYFTGPAIDEHDELVNRQLDV